MHTEFTNDRTVRLMQALRLEDLVINAGAVPLPLTVSPSLIPQDALPDSATETTRESPALPPSDHTGQGEATPVGDIHADRAPATDPLTDNLEAARAAIHQSLSHDVASDGIAFAHVPALEADEAGALQLLPMASRAPIEAETGSPHPTLADGAADRANPGGVAPALVLTSDGAHASQIALDLSNGVTTPEAAHPLTALMGDVVSVPDGTVAPALSGGVASINVAPASEQHVAQFATSTVDAVLGAVPSANPLTAATLGNDVAQLAGPVPTATPVAMHTVGEVQVVTDAVTVPSLHGFGFDALFGSPPAAATGAATGPTPPPAIAADLPVLAPIGFDDVTHHDDAAALHALHALLPAPGTGLI